MSKIEQIISEMEEYIDGCRFQPLSNSKIIVNKDELADFLDDLRQNLPDEIKKYQRIISNRDAILKDAQDKAEEMIKKANEMTSTLVSEHEIMQQAFREANKVIDDATKQAGKIVDDATVEANEIKLAAVQYTDESLENIQNIFNNAIEGLNVKYDGIIRSLQSGLDVATRNREQLREFSVEQSDEPEEYTEETDEYIQEEYDIPNGTENEEYVEDTYEPAGYSDSYGDKTIGEALDEGGKDYSSYDDIPNISDYGSIDEIKDFNLDFDEIKPR